MGTRQLSAWELTNTLVFRQPPEYFNICRAQGETEQRHTPTPDADGRWSATVGEVEERPADMSRPGPGGVSPVPASKRLRGWESDEEDDEA